MTVSGALGGPVSAKSVLTTALISLVVVVGYEHYKGRQPTVRRGV